MFFRFEYDIFNVSYLFVTYLVTLVILGIELCLAMNLAKMIYYFCNFRTT
jgi:hypothetical protein